MKTDLYNRPISVKRGLQKTILGVEERYSYVQICQKKLMYVKRQLYVYEKKRPVYTKIDLYM